MLLFLSVKVKPYWRFLAVTVSWPQFVAAMTTHARQKVNGPRWNSYFCQLYPPLNSEQQMSAESFQIISVKPLKTSSYSVWQTVFGEDEKCVQLMLTQLIKWKVQNIIKSSYSVRVFCSLKDCTEYVTYSLITNALLVIKNLLIDLTDLKVRCAIVIILTHRGLELPV